MCNKKAVYHKWSCNQYNDLHYEIVIKQSKIITFNKNSPGYFTKNRSCFETKNFFKSFVSCVISKPLSIVRTFHDKGKVAKAPWRLTAKQKWRPKVVKDKKSRNGRVTLLVQYITSHHEAFQTLPLRSMGLLQVQIVK